MDFLQGSSPNFSLPLFFHNVNEWVHQKFKQTFFYNTNGCLCMDEKEIVEKWVIVTKLKEMKDIDQNKIELAKII